jgi:pimeloyl-ACP methyl ester carboxylesterase
MIARLCRLIVALQLGACVCAALLAESYLSARLGRVGAPLVAVGLVLAVHPSLTLLYFANSRLLATHPPPGQQLALWRWPLTYLFEYASSWRGFCYANPFLSGHATPAPRAPLRATPILFVHGYFCTGAVWLPLMKALARRGYRVTALTLESAFGDIDDYAAPIEAAFARLLEASQASSAIVVSHSMGGLAVRAWMRRYGDARVRHVFALGTPHQGTRLAANATEGNVGQMAPDSAWLRALAASETPLRRARITNLFSYHDNIILPQASSMLQGTRSIAFSGLGHVSLLYSRRIWKILMAELDALDARSEISRAPRAAAG